MKNMKTNMAKRVLSVFTAVIMLVMVMAPATVMAAPERGNIRIYNAHMDTTSMVGQTFKAYKVFDVTAMGAGDEISFVYAPTAAFADLNTVAGYDVIAAMSAAGADLDAIANDIKAYIVAKDIAPTETATGGEGDYDKVTIEDVELGYYFVEGTVKDNSGGIVQSKYMLFEASHIGNDTKVRAKVDAPTISKKVWDDHDGAVIDEFETGDTWKDVTDVNVGDIVDFKLESNVPNIEDMNFDEYTFIMHDKMSAGLTLDPDSFEVYVGGNLEDDRVDNDAVKLVEDTDYEITIPTGAHAADCNFEIEFTDIPALSEELYGDDAPSQLDQTWAAGIEGVPIYVFYQAELNENAVLYNPGNPNAVKLEYSNSPYSTNTNITPEDKAVVFSFDLDLVKYTGNATGDVPTFEQGKGIYTGETTLAGAEFALYTEAATEASRVAVGLVRTVAGDTTASAVYRLPKATDAPEDITTKLISPASGRIEINGIDEGLYYLKETKAPAGYSLLTEDLQIMIRMDYNFDAMDGYTGGVTDGGHPQGLDKAGTASSNVWEVKYKGNAEGSVSSMDLSEYTDGHYIRVKNVGGSQLPETGGMGTQLFIYGGLALMLAAGAILATRKKATNK